MSRLVLKSLFNHCMFAFKNEKTGIGGCGKEKQQKGKKKIVHLLVLMCLNYILHLKS